VFPPNCRLESLLLRVLATSSHSWLELENALIRQSMNGSIVSTYSFPVNDAVLRDFRLQSVIARDRMLWRSSSVAIQLSGDGGSPCDGWLP